MDPIAERIEAHALMNAIRYGEALTGKVIPKILGEFPEARTNVASLKAKIDETVLRVNAMSETERQKRIEEIAPDLLEKPKPKKKELPDLPNAQYGRVVTRLPPEPSKYNHLGHALTFIINAIYARKYGGRLVLRFEDANPDKVSQEFVDAMRFDIEEYLGIMPDKTLFVSDHMGQLIAYAETLISKGGAYLCFCPRDEMSAKRRAGEGCGCRDVPVEKNLAEWKKFKAGEYGKGETVLRYKGEMDSKNTVLRDPVLWRAIDTPHFRLGSKYSVWPLYDFYSPVEEHLCGVTHIIRSNEFDLRVELHRRIQETLGLAKPEVFHYGRFNIRGATTKGREIRDLIESGAYRGWDDPRLVTLQALRRRGIQKDAYWRLVEDLGLSPYPVSLDFSMLAAKNREIVDPIASRYSFIEDPVEITIEGVPEHSVELDLHPDRKDGGRPMRSAGSYLVRRSDHAGFEESRYYRLKGDLTFKKEDGRLVFVTQEYLKEHNTRNINWLPAEETVPARVLMPDGQWKEGLAERNIGLLDPGAIVQLERFGFCRFDGLGGESFEFWYAHD